MHAHTRRGVRTDRTRRLDADAWSGARGQGRVVRGAAFSSFSLSLSTYLCGQGRSLLFLFSLSLPIYIFSLSTYLCQPCCGQGRSLDADAWSVKRARKRAWSGAHV